MDGTQAGDIWDRVRLRRVAVADRIEAAGPEWWDAPSWCAGWRVRDVLGHLVHLAEATQVSMVRDVLGHGVRPDAALRHMAIAVGQAPVPVLAQRLRQAVHGHFRIIGMPRSVVLGELLVHGEDALRATGSSADPAPTDVRPVLDLYRRIGPVAFGTRRVVGVRLVATDTDWSSGAGPEVQGKAIDLLLLLANREQAQVALSGAGLATLER